jgi:hypothetical protein
MPDTRYAVAIMVALAVLGVWGWWQERRGD